MVKQNNSDKKYIFFLKDINTEIIDQRFGIIIKSNIKTKDKTPRNATKISDLCVNKNIHTVISFLDEAKKEHKCSISMIDFNTNNDILVSDIIYNCFWCRNFIPKTVKPIGCPIKYVASQVIKTYFSEISKDTYTIKENITANKQLILENETKNNSNININNKNYYVTDGIFCSFNCCMAYITDNKIISMYNISEMLLLKMYNDIYSKEISLIENAPHWRKLIQYGGDLTIEEYRNSFNKIEYKNHGFISNIQKFNSLGIIFEEKLKFK